MKGLMCYILIIFTLVACGKDAVKSNSEDYKSSLTACFDPVNNMSGCCSDHGGIKKCGSSQGSYLFTLEKKAICTDGTISVDCEGQR